MSQPFWGKGYASMPLALFDLFVVAWFISGYGVGLVVIFVDFKYELMSMFHLVHSLVHNEICSVKQISSIIHQSNSAAE